MANLLLADVRATVAESLARLERMRDSYAVAVVECNWVVELRGGFLRYTPKEGAVLRDLTMANTYTKERAAKVAEVVYNGVAQKGRPVAVRDAIRSEIDRVNGLLQMLDAAA